MPHSSAEPSPAELAACRALLRGGSRSFSVAAKLLPGRTRDAATSLYAFCRAADDTIDDCEGDRHAAIAGLGDRLRLACAGTPSPHPADRALAHVIATHAIPPSLLEALIEGFSWDAESRRYETLDDLTAYATRVAGTVGAMMALLMGTRDPDALARAIELGIAMQFTNIARDVGEDARAGRLYLPLAWLRGARLDPDRLLADPRPSPELATLVARLLREADILYARADAGIAALPSRCRPAIRAARRIYTEIGRAVERNACDSISTRAVVPLSRKLAVLPRVLFTTPAESLAEPPLPQAAFLIASLGAVREPQRRRRVADRAIWLIDLFARLESGAVSSLAETAPP